MRLDFPQQPGQGSVGGLEDLEQLLKAAIKASFETRAAAYEEEVCNAAECLCTRPLLGLKYTLCIHASLILP